MPIPKLVKVDVKFERTTNSRIRKISFVAPCARWEAVLKRRRKINAGSKKIRIDFIVRLMA